MLSKISTAQTLAGLYLISALLLFLPGCLATRGWVSEQLKPVDTRMASIEREVSETKSRLSGVDPRFAKAVATKLKHLDNRVVGTEQRVTGIENRLSQVSSKTEKTLTELKDFQLERRLVMDLKAGAHFQYNSAMLREPAKRKIDQFLGTFQGQPLDNYLFYVAGFTDNTGSSEKNYQLGRKRADSVGRYLIVRKGIHPTRVLTVSGGDGHPVANNSTLHGRAKNRRVEILVYKDRISAVKAEIAATLSRMAVTPEVTPGAPGN